MFMHTTMPRRAHAGSYREGNTAAGWDIMGVGLIALAFALATTLVFIL